MAPPASNHLAPPPRDETAVFQHSPAPDTKLKTEWEPGCQPDEIYDRYLPAWRAWLRRKLVKRLREEKDWMADWQKRIRSGGRDRFFYWTAIFGTHTFFMTFLPVLFFFGFPLQGRGLLYVVGLGIYISSFAKDLVCTPRPYSPPVIRLSMSTHHHEYGFPSSHSTNSTSIALFFGEWLYNLRDHVGMPTVIAGWIFLAIYAGSVIGGRLYTGMHSTADIIGGALMGTFCWLFWIFVGDQTEAWVNTGTWLVPAISVPLTLAMVHYHPQPLDDCPCFEDAIAVLSVILGSFLGHWWGVVTGQAVPAIVQREPFSESEGLIMGAGIAIFRLVLGLGLMFAWRLVVKTSLLRVLPPIFRVISKLSGEQLPTRRFYKAATDYQAVPQKIAFRQIPSVVDLQIGENDSSSGISPVDSPLLNGKALKSPTSYGIGEKIGLRKRSSSTAKEEERMRKDEEIRLLVRLNKRKGDRAKYDAEVLTKVGVYAGIGAIATTFIPILFRQIETGVFG
ncbi:hypothetical protein I302_101227 [Kwoniella bestiolae CBS 10118]|uniref:Phosphatidic acid phosphatase type 2/haloperoxidase domain-containing protein n=1 Tax=Kwoniella bestiolae CBS 10118 TaxID=1296100 RepID=A0A1B9G798_9TREE|nr:hypothetical protein I302_04600 [Kwoniella bestiolae CBS 10118]OCF26909.1 hypothetical protein I302_04600 [Kwoniella bestiolae CBS 10118]